MSDAGRWLTLVGLGEDGLEGLSPIARKAIDEAEFIVGGKRHLELVGPVKAETMPWPSPLNHAFPRIWEKRGKKVVVLATGDPFFHGVGSLLVEQVPPTEILSLPAPSAYALAASRLGWAGQDVRRISLHGRALERIYPHLHNGARIFALSWDETTPGILAKSLVQRGFGASRITVLERMGGPKERIRDSFASGFDIADIDPLNTIALEVRTGSKARIQPFTPGLADTLFENDGQITKREIRAVTLSTLAPRHGELLWDIGAGSGSIAIEWMLADPSLTAVAIEQDAERAARILRNAADFGVRDLRVETGAAPDALKDLPAPDAIFIGGGAPACLEAARSALKPGGRLVVNAVTLETQSFLTVCYRRHGGDLMQIQVSRAGPVGGFTALKPAMAVTQWVWEKPLE
ncbi:Precorrin-6Y C(5,15)-methyltransferase [decarboxylating] [Hartmannibacter diazotrophicus]|uniref:Precorrin-6Y C(5,15)-methyltransferase [decarboxylating] n=1 Tax=Hartmannibacter diazotrophicus TaxID=1482074 RepID=A0A2C9D8P7_9HYPH|nr:precorrin-6y C5,15-methyltransferase (decarboxylating) subunit CbiE [Hartmannibacter diazotrophicus]SON56603.1 Precorrin-6Y C(5,15)-methyltransferase [decarboxylating] [Hartmannibacter diazotrophicus]